MIKYIKKSQQPFIQDRLVTKYSRPNRVTDTVLPDMTPSFGVAVECFAARLQEE
jgi:hypothetical protein